MAYHSSESRYLLLGEQNLTGQGQNYLAMSVLNQDTVCMIRLRWESKVDRIAVVQNPEDASTREAAFDYVLLCVKALPDVYNIADIIQTVVTPQHTCILVNTTNTLGVEKHLEERFPTNVVLSLVSRADLTQLGASEFEHTGSTEIWVGPATENPAIPQAIQRDMSEALAMTLTTGNVECKVSNNIQQQQFERMIG